MKKQILMIVSVLLFIVLLGFAASLFGGNPISLDSLKGQTILYYGNTCPHCKDLEEYIKTNKIDDKSFTRKEVYADLKNSRELTAVAKSCKIDVNNIGVPFLYKGSKCYMGNDEIIASFGNPDVKPLSASSGADLKK